MPEPIVPQDGTEKNDGERKAAKRLRVKLRQDHPHLTLLVTADRRRANAPHIHVRHDHNRHDILGVKAGDQASLFAHVAAAEQAGRVTSDARDDAETGVHHRLRFGSDMPRHAAHADLRVNGLEGWEWDGDQGQHVSWVTDLRVTQGPVYQSMRGGRARWRIATEPFNPLKNQGEHFAHKYGQGDQPLSVVLAVRLLLAFVVEQVQPRCCPLCQAVWAKLGSKRRRWERRSALGDDDALDSLRHLCEALLYGGNKTAPIFAVDASSSPWICLGDTVRPRETTPGRGRAVAP
jgi:hypothetical protein